MWGANAGRVSTILLQEEMNERQNGSTSLSCMVDGWLVIDAITSANVYRSEKCHLPTPRSFREIFPGTVICFSTPRNLIEPPL